MRHMKSANAVLARVLSFLAGLLATFPAGAGLIRFHCEGHDRIVGVSLDLRDLKKGRLTVIENSHAPVSCELGIVRFDDRRGGPSPQLSLRFEKKKCSPDLTPSLQKRLLNETHLLILTTEKPRATFRWLRDQEAVECRITEFKWTPAEK